MTNQKINNNTWNHMVSVLTGQIKPSSNGCHYVEAYLISDQRVGQSTHHARTKASQPSGKGSTHV